MVYSTSWSQYKKEIAHEKNAQNETKSAFYDFLDTSSVLNRKVNKNGKHENKNILKGKMAQWNEVLYEVALNFSTIYIF